jgi:hypothetical protein
VCSDTDDADLTGDFQIFAELLEQLEVLRGNPIAVGGAHLYVSGQDPLL